MSRTIEQWVLFKYVKGEFTLLSKPFKSKAQAEKARLKLPERQRKMVAIGVTPVKSSNLSRAKQERRRWH